MELNDSTENMIVILFLFRVGADHGQEEVNNALEDGVNPDIINDHSRHKGPDSTTKRKILL